MATLNPVRIVYLDDCAGSFSNIAFSGRQTAPILLQIPPILPPHIYAQKASPIFLPERLVCFLPSFLTRRGAVDLFIVGSNSIEKIP